MFFLETVCNKDYKDINPVQFGYQSCVGSHSYGPAIRTYWLLHYVVSGEGRFKIRGNEYKVTPGNIFVIPPYVETYYEADGKNPWQYIWVGFNMSENIDVVFKDVMYMPSASAIFNSIKKCSDMVSGRTEFLCGKIWHLIAEISENSSITTHNIIEEAVSIVNSEYMYDITVQNIADRIGLERTYFSDCFKKKIGISPKKFLLKVRMEHAASLLKEYGYGVSLTALSVGYADTYTFSKMFKRYFGVSPTEYKNGGQVKQKNNLFSKN